jgi:3',5'-nucleoside bisphosphate phosphatase
LKIDLHIHTKTGSDGNLPVEEVVYEAARRDIKLLSITDHDNLAAQEKAVYLTKQRGIEYVAGIELNVTFQYPGSKQYSLDFLGYKFNINDFALIEKLNIIRKERVVRAHKILDNLNTEFAKENLPRFTEKDLENIEETVDGTLGRPHIANYLIKKGIVNNKQEAFDKYLVKCDVPKYPLSLEEASKIIHDAGGIIILAHPNDPNGTSLRSISVLLEEQVRIISSYMLKYIDGIECWHSRHDENTADYYLKYASDNGLTVTGGSDCHQKPVLMGSVDIPEFVAKQFIK